MKITDNIIKLECTSGSYAYVIKDKNVTMIDTSIPGRGNTILEELSKNGISPEDLKRILITHHDIDHIGNAAFLTEKCGCDVYISKTDLPYAQGIIKRDGIKKVLGIFMKATLSESVKVVTGNKIDDIEVST